MKKTISILLALLMLALCMMPAAMAEGSEEAATAEAVAEETKVEASTEEATVEAADETYGFEYWTPGAASLAALVAFVDDVTDENSPHFVPVEDRIAVFDMDGTLYGELAPIYVEWAMFAYRVLDDSRFTPDEEMVSVAEEVRAVTVPGNIPSGLEVRQATQNARAYAGMTLTEFADYVNNFILKDAVGFENMIYASAFYLPMIEVVDYLQENDFKVYICSGSDRFLCRVLLDGWIDVPADQIIGMDVRLEAQGQAGADGLEYVYTPGDLIVRTGELLVKNVKANKPFQIAQEIGRQPIISFGNSSGDTSMAMYVTHNNKYHSAAFMVVADDTERDYGNAEKAAKLAQTWTDNGWVVISEKNDWLTIYGYDVVKTSGEETAEAACSCGCSGNCGCCK